MYVKFHGQMNSFHRIKLTSNAALTMVYTETEAGIKDVYKCSSDSPNHYLLRNLRSSVFSIPSDFVCGNKGNLF